MAARVESGLERPAVALLPRRHPWLVASLAAHGLLVAGLYTAGPVRIEYQRDQGVRTQVERSLQHTAQQQMQRELRTMEEIRDALAQSAGEAQGQGEGAKEAAHDTAKDAAKAAGPGAKARALARQIEAVQRRIRATEMARLLRIPEAEALRRVKAEEARRPPAAMPKNLPPEAQVAQLAQQARAALAQRRAQLQAQQQGVAVKMGGAGTPGAGPQAAAGAHGLGKGGGAGAGMGHSGTQSASTGGRIDALMKGLGLGAPGAITGSSLDMSSSAFSDARAYGAYLAPPPVDAGRLRLGSGRTIGSGGPYANRVYLDTWYIIGPFEGQGRDSQQAVYPPERGVDLDAVYYGKNRLPVRWTFQQDAHYPSVPLPRAENAVYYAYTEVEVDRDIDLWAWIGADDDSKMWFNDRLVWISSTVDDKPWYRQPFYGMRTETATRNLTEGQRRLHFHKGRNTVLFKLYNGLDLMFFSMVLSP